MSSITGSCGESEAQRQFELGLQRSEERRQETRQLAAQDAETQAAGVVTVASAGAQAAGQQDSDSGATSGRPPGTTQVFDLKEPNKGRLIDIRV